MKYRNCPVCNGIISYNLITSYYGAVRNNAKCSHCYRSINAKKRMSDPIFKESLRQSHTNRYNDINEINKTSEALKKKWKEKEYRNKMFSAIEKTKWIRVRSDIGQLEFLEKWNRLGFNFIPNYQLKTDSDLFYLDGYDKSKNVVIEYDGKYHSKSKQYKKDKNREQKIIDILNPIRFWRFNVKTNVLTQIIQNNNQVNNIESIENNSQK